MRPFTYERANDLAQVSRLAAGTGPGTGSETGPGTGQGQTDAAVQFLAGGTTLVDLMKLDVLRPQRLIDLGGIQKAHSGIESNGSGLKLGALAKMSAVANHPMVLAHYRAVAQSLQLAASAQLRNMATLGGNVLQKTRCPYYRDTSWKACNKRTPGSGCAALQGFNRNHAVLGVNEHCIAQYPGDFGVVLAALDARVDLVGPKGPRTIPFDSLHTPSNDQPHIETTLRSGEIITAFHIPAGEWNRRSLYLKIRDRASYEFAISSAAVALDLDGDNIRAVRIGLGGMAYRPWRAKEAEATLTGKPLTEANAVAAAKAALADATTHGYNDYKPELARRTLVRALLQAKAT